MLTEAVLRNSGYIHRFHDVDGAAVRHAFHETYSYTARMLKVLAGDLRIRKLSSIIYDLREGAALGLDAGPRPVLGARLAAEQGWSHLAVCLRMRTLFNLVAEDIVLHTAWEAAPALSPLTNMRIDYVRWTECMAGGINERGGSV